MKKVITYGTYDLLHEGHIALLNRAKELGDYLIVGVTSDEFDKSRGKLNVQESLMKRVEAVKATGLADKIIIEEYEGQKIADILKYKVDVFTVGSDWKGKFDYLKKYCNVIYLRRTEGISSTELRDGARPIIRMGLVGAQGTAGRFLNEAFQVHGVKIMGVYDPSFPKLLDFCDEFGIMHFDTYEDLLSYVDVVYITASINENYNLIMKGLTAKKHVMCNAPMFLNILEAKKAIKYANENKLILFEAVKTMYFPAFKHLILLVNSGIIGEVVDVDVSCSQVPINYDDLKNNKYQGAIYDWASIALLPILKLLGTEIVDTNIYGKFNGDFNTYVRGIVQYKNGVGSFKVGRGTKTEGNLIITGTKGYVYVPSPWWKTEYFEVRYEDIRDSKKYFYKFSGEGFRYEILEFLKTVYENESESYFYGKKEVIAVTEILEVFKDKVKIIK